MSRRVIVAATSLLLAGCAGSGAVLRTGASTLPASWSSASVRGTDVALHNEGGGSIAATVACDAVDEDAPLDVLANHLLLELDTRVEHSREPLVVDGRGGLRVRLSVRLDGVEVALELVVFKKDGCVVDAQLAAAPARIGALRPDFERFLAGLAMTRRVSR